MAKAASPRAVLLEAFAPLLAKVKGARLQAVRGRESFFVGDKVLAFPRPQGLAVKLPAETVARLVEEGRAVPLVMGKRAMKEWAVLPPSAAGDAKATLALLKEAAAFTAASSDAP